MNVEEMGKCPGCGSEMLGDLADDMICHNKKCSEFCVVRTATEVAAAHYLKRRETRPAADADVDRIVASQLDRMDGVFKRLT